MKNRYKVVWYHPQVVFAKPYAPTLAKAREIAEELLHTRLCIVKPLGANILRRGSFRFKGAKYIDWVPVAKIGSVPS